MGKINKEVKDRYRRLKKFRYSLWEELMLERFFCDGGSSSG